MDVASVTLEEVLKAAQVRAASLVPETSGYLALAIADASARLPFFIEDDMVVLSTEGTVRVMRGTEVVPGERVSRRVSGRSSRYASVAIRRRHARTHASVAFSARSRRKVSPRWWPTSKPRSFP